MQRHTLWTSVWDRQWAKAAKADHLCQSSLYVRGSVPTVPGAPNALGHRLDHCPTGQWLPAILATQSHSTEASWTASENFKERKKGLFFNIYQKSTMTSRQEVWKLVVKGINGVCKLVLRAVAHFFLLGKHSASCTMGSASRASAFSHWFCPFCKVHPLHITPTPHVSQPQPLASRSPRCFQNHNFLHFKSKFYLDLSRYTFM